MKIAIIGAGAVGGALGTGWARSGHEILFGVRDTKKPALVRLCEETGATAMTAADAAAAGDVVVLAIPWDGAEESVGGLGSLPGKTVIDCTNPLAFDDGELRLDRGFSTSGAEAIAAWLPGANVVKGMNQAPAELMSGTEGLEGTPVMFIAGDDDDAKATAAGLIGQLGFEVLDAGSLAQSRLLEPFAMVFINQALARGMGRDWAFGVLRYRG